MKNNKKKILIYSILGVVTLLIVTLTITYAYWILTKQQTGENVVNTACLNITFTGENDITLDKAYPMNPEQLEEFLSTETPYHFTIHNECNDLASATINLESLNAEGEKQLEDQYINAILYEDDSHNNLNSVKKLSASIYNDENKVIANSLHAYKLHSFTLKGGETKDFNLLLYMDSNTPMEDANMNASWKGKITLSTEYKVDSKAIRQISYNDSNGMWGYKDKLTKIVIEDTKSKKQAPEGGQVYGPFDESEYETKAVESYVVCEADDANCVGYIQSDGKVIANPDSSYLFAYFSKVNEINGLENLDVSQVNSMSEMFWGLGITSIDLSMWDTSKVTKVSGIFGSDNLTNINISNWDLSSTLSSVDSGLNSMFNWNVETINMSNFIFPKDSRSIFVNGLTKLNNIILDNVDTTKVTDMSGMFSGCSGLEKLDLSDFNTSNVTNMRGMFEGCSSLQSLDLSSFDVKKVEIMESIFNRCSNLNSLNVSNWDLSNSKSTLTIFNNLQNLETINMTNFVFQKDSSGFFAQGLPKLNEIILTNADTSNVINMQAMFMNCQNLSSLDLSDFNTSNVTNMNALFLNDTNLQSITFGPKFVHNPGSTTSDMFSGCPSQDRLTDESWQDVNFN